MTTMFDFGFLKENLIYVELFGQNWLIPLILSFLLVIIITRRPNKWGIVYLPLIIGLRTIGLYFSLPVYMAMVTLGGLIFATSSLGTDVIGGSIRGAISDSGKRIKGYKGYWSDVRTSRSNIKTKEKENF